MTNASLKAELIRTSVKNLQIFHEEVRRFLTNELVDFSSVYTLLYIPVVIHLPN